MGWFRRLFGRPEPPRYRGPNPVSGRPMEENPWNCTFAPEYVEGLRRQGHDVSEMEPWVEAGDD